MSTPTILIPIEIPFDYRQRHRDAVNPALEYLAWTAWPDATSQDQANRDGVTTALAAALWKSPRGKATRHAPPELPRINPRNIAGTVRKTIQCIEQQRLPAALMVLSHWVRTGMTDLSRAGLTMGQQVRIAEAVSGPTDAFATAAGRLRHLNPVVDPANVPAMPLGFRDIGADAWVRSRLALAMTLALPVSWSAMAGRTKGRDEYSAVAALCYDPTWVQEAVNNAGVLAGRLAQTLDPPPSSLNNPKIVRVRSDARLVPIDGNKLFRLLNPHLALSPGGSSAL